MPIICREQLELLLQVERTKQIGEEPSLANVALNLDEAVRNGLIERPPGESRRYLRPSPEALAQILKDWTNWEYTSAKY